MNHPSSLLFASLPSPLQQILSSHVLCTLLTTILCLVCYWNSLEGELVHDDIFAIKNNQDINPTTPLIDIFKNDFWGEPMSSVVSHKSYRPLTVLTFRFNYWLHGLSPWGYHVINVLLHVMCTSLFGVLCRLVVFEGYSDLSFLATCFFATHSIHTEAVTGIVGRADVLACIFFLLSFLFYWSSCYQHKLWKRYTKLLLCLLCGTVAMLCKEHGATVFGVCMIYDVFIVHGSTIYRSMKDRRLPVSKFGPLITRCLILLLATAGLLLFRISLLHGHLPHFSVQDNPASFSESFTTRALTYCYLYFFNARLLLFPYILCYDWQMGSIPLVESLMDLRNFSSLIFFVGLLSLSYISLLGSCSQRHRHTTIIGLALLVVPFLPASNLLLRVGFVVAERILYIPSMGSCVLVVLGVSRLYQRFKSTLPFHLSLVLIAFLSWRTVSRNPVWFTRESLFRSGLETVPNNAKIHFNFANYLKDNGRVQEAIQHYQQAISLAPDHAVSHNNLGTLLNTKEAEYHFRAAVKNNPRHYRAFFNLARNLEKQGRMEEAEEAYRECLNINSDYGDALMGLGMLMADTGRGNEGLPFMEQAVQLSPENANNLNNMATFLTRMGRHHEAIDTFLKALKVDPLHTTAMTSLGRAYRTLGDDVKAEKYLKKSLSIKQEASTYHYLAAIYHNTGRLTEAKTTFEQALRLDPHNLETTCSYGQTLLQLGEFHEAIRVLSEAMMEHPQGPCLHLGLANMYLHTKDLQKALNYSTMAKDFSSDKISKAEALHLRGGILKDLGYLDDAEKSYRSAVSLNPSKSASHLNLGAVYHMQKKYKEARSEYEEALRLDPSNKIIADNIKKLDRIATTATKT